jgi:hypothetical protein
MTIAASWIRKVKNCEELVFISDSRLCGGHRWDECPKIMTFSCENCVLCFAGSTDYSYPMMMQINYSMSEFNRIRTRAMDLGDLNGYVLKHINHLSQSVYNMADPDDQYQNEFIFGGYSWVKKEFRMWRYYYNKTLRAFIKDGAPQRIISNVPGNIKVIGDQSEVFKSKLRRILQDRYGFQCCNYNGFGLDMEPFEALCNLLKQSSPSNTIGGAPQMVKAYQFMNSRPVGIYWPEKTADLFKNRTLLGRQMFDFEDTELWFMDPETFITNSCNKRS